MQLSIQKMFYLLARIQPLQAAEEKLEMWNDSGNILLLSLTNVSCQLRFVAYLS